MQKNFIVYKSSAGSGKTFTLVKEYLKIVLNDKSKVKSVLAITFTNAAAAEMKTRIIETLGNISKLKVSDYDNWPDDLKEMMCYIAGIDSDNKSINYEDSYHNIINNSGEVLSQILHNYGDFAVSTIDSFTHRIIRTFAFDLQIPMNFDIELDAKSLLSQAVDILISRIGTDSDGSFTRLMVAYMERTTDEEKKLSVEKGMLELAENIMKEDLDNNVEMLRSVTLEDFFNIQEQILSGIKLFENKISSIAQSIVIELDNRNIPDSSFFRGAHGISTYFRNLAKGLIDEKIEPNNYVYKTIEEDKWFAGKATPTDQAAIFTVKGYLSEAFIKIQDIAENEISYYRLLKLINRNIFPLAVLNEVEKVLEEIKSQNSILHISDFNKKIAAIIAEQPVPFIYERLGEKYQHYMIDEFQDTSLLQWQNLLPLVENALSNGNMNLVVGDCKQAIYRWRGGEVEQFANLPEISPKIKGASKTTWQRALNNYYNYRPLDTNYRSNKAIVDFNNSFFKYIYEEVLTGEAAKIYEGFYQHNLKKNDGGYVQIDFIPTESEEEDNALLNNTLNNTLATIIELRNNYNHPLRDITVLCRSNFHANYVARFLIENGIKVISQESLLLEFSPDVGFFISFLRQLVKPADTVSYTETLHYLTNKGFVKNADNIHDALKSQNEFPLKQASLKNSSGNKLENLLKKCLPEFSLESLKRMNLSDICEFLVQKFFSQNDSVNPFVAFFMDAVFDFTEKHSTSIDDFLQWWEEKKKDYSVVVPKGIDAVQIMTIHKAKGLQFPVVIFPFVNMNTIKPGLNGFWHSVESKNIAKLPVAYFNYTKKLENTELADYYHEEKQRTLLDLLNVVYVGFTRARQKLFIMSNYPKNTSFSEAKNTIAHYLYMYLNSQELWIDGLTTYEFGENSALALSYEDDDFIMGSTSFADEPAFKKYISSDWRKKINIRPALKAPSSTDPQKSAIVRGMLMHRVLERVYEKDDVKKVLNHMFANGQISFDEINAIEPQIYALLESGELSEYYEKGLKVLNEAEIMDEDGSFYRPDRVVIDGEKAVVIDYKTGTPVGYYKNQILNYKSLLSKMGYKPIEGYLVYLDQGFVERVN